MEITKYTNMQETRRKREQKCKIYVQNTIQ